jgi:hypothetical protein
MYQDGGLDWDRYSIFRKKDRPGELVPVPHGHRFVLNCDNDPHARTALAAYAESVKTENAVLAKDIQEFLKQ